MTRPQTPADAIADAQARFHALVLPHLDRLLGFARRRTEDGSDAEDAVQEACVKAWLAFGDLRDKSLVRPWLYRILRGVLSVKVLRPEVVAADPLAFARFTEEVRMARRITHRNVVRTHDLAEHDAVPFITMEYVKGASLATIINTRGALPAATIISIGKQLMRALAVAHEQGVVHGDLKPQNVLICANGTLKVSDFGVARLVRNAIPERQRLVPSGEQMQIARVGGAIVGTPEYLSPELLLGATANTASDIYAAGMVLHECLTGATPFQVDTPAAFMSRKMDSAMSAPARVSATLTLTRSGARADELTGHLHAIVAGMTDSEPHRRPGSAAEVGNALSALAKTPAAGPTGGPGIDRGQAVSQE